MHELVSLLCGGEALIDVLVLVVDEVLVLLKLVVFAAEELVELWQPWAVHSLAIRLRTVVDVNVVAEILKAVVHVRAGINIEVLTLTVGDGESISLSSIWVFAEEGRQQRTIGLTVHILEDLVVEEADTEEWESLPSPGELLEVANTRNSLKAEPEASKPSEGAVAAVSLVEIIKSLSVLNGNVVWEEVNIFTVDWVNIEPFKTVVLNHVFLEPGSTGDLGHTREVSEWRNLIEHI
jgi:hypothetical protein